MQQPKSKNQAKSANLAIGKQSLLFTIVSILLLTLPKTVSSVKCYACLFHLAHCTNPLDCYNQPDTCSNMNFSPVLTQTLECEFGCEQYVVTDATGSMVVWRRGCATEGSPRSSYICFSRNIYFLRHEQCWCHSDYCNSSSRSQANPLIIITGLVASILMLQRVNSVGVRFSRG